MMTTTTLLLLVLAGTPATIQSNCVPELDTAGRLARTLAVLGGVNPKHKTNMELNGALMAVDKDGNCVSVRRAATPALVRKVTAISHANGGSGRVIHYVNGIRTTWKDHCKTLRAIGRTTCAKVIGIYNATNGAVRDFGECAADTANITRNKLRTALGLTTNYIGANPAVKRLAALLSSQISRGRRPELWAHSQGGLISSLALSHVANTHGAGRRFGIGRVILKSFASAAPWWPSGPSYHHFIHTNDMVPVNLGLGRSGNHHVAGHGARFSRFNGEPGRFRYLPNGKWASIPYPTSYHDMEKIYLRYYKRVFGDCRGGAGRR